MPYLFPNKERYHSDAVSFSPRENPEKTQADRKKISLKAEDPRLSSMRRGKEKEVEKLFGGIPDNTS